MLQQVRHRQRFVDVGHGLAHPHERRPHRRRAGTIPAYQDPLQRYHQQERTEAIQHAGEGQDVGRLDPLFIFRDRHHDLHDQVARGDHEGQRQHNAQRLDHRAADLPHPRRPEGQRLGKTFDPFARRQQQRRRAHPGLARAGVDRSPASAFARRSTRRRARLPRRRRRPRCPRTSGCRCPSAAAPSSRRAILHRPASRRRR